MESLSEGISPLLADYFDGLYNGDVAKLASVFHTEARYSTAAAGRLVHLSMPEYFEIVRHRPSPASKNEPRSDRVISLIFAGPTAVMAHVSCQIAPKKFNDLLSIVFCDGRWQIIAKVFHYELTE